MASLTAVGAAVSTTLARIGDSDCENLGTGFLAQPVNALSSLAYVVVGIAIALCAGWGPHDRARSWVFAACLAAIGLGSVAFHGPQPAGSRLMHDLPILITALFILCHDLSLLVPSFRRVLPVFGLVALAGVGLTLISVDAVAIAVGAALIAVAGCELTIFRRGMRPLPGQQQGQSYIFIIIVAAVAGASWLLGRTDGPLCDPGSVLQPHGLWHVISAVVFGLWWWLAFELPARANSSDLPVVESAR